MMLLITMFFFMIMISLILMIINFFISKKKNNNREKASPFECGFDPLTSSRLPFSIQFYLISIIFLIFDIEIVIFLPLISSFYNLNCQNWLNLSFYFIFILMFGLYIEWFDGALMWLK
uniref:NADH-ubiquinone oxidoreductase chain 3 n=1 Tax=Pimpla luctuosa TaxID=495389 RepID=A0A3Q8UA82_9HYME|nr:NADH dehydrogenase subunit 3 [Pimpla luctuosa]